MRSFVTFALFSSFCLFSTAFSSSSNAQAEKGSVSTEVKKTVKVSPLQLKKNQANRNVLGLITGDAAGTNVQIGADVAEVVSGQNLRVVPIVGQGARKNIDDLLYLRSADIAIIQQDVLEHFNNNGKYGDLKKKLRYIAKLYHEEVHIIAKKGIQSIDELEGKLVNFGLKESGSSIAAEAVFKRRRIGIRKTNFDQRKALQLLKNGEISAMVYVVGKPVSLLRSVTSSDGLHILNIPFDPELYEQYLPSSFSSSDYPALIPNGKRVETLATSSILAAYNWSTNSSKYKLINRFVRKLFDHKNELLDASHHPKWKEFSVSAKIYGWTRFRGADEKIKELRNNIEISSLNGDLQQQFDSFLKSQKVNLKDMNDEQRNALFRGFISWANKK